MVIDVIVVLVGLSGFLYGFSKGILKVVLYIVAIVAGTYATLLYTPPLTGFLADSFPDYPMVLPFAAIFILFFGTMIIFRIILRLLEGFLKVIDINIFNKMMGGLIFSLVSLILLSALLSFADAAGLISYDLEISSKTYAYIQGLPEKGADWLKAIFPYLRDLAENIRLLIEEAKNK